MSFVPAELARLVARYRAEKRSLAAGSDGAERLCAGFVEPLLRLLGWDVEGGQGQVERLVIPCLDQGKALCAYLLHEQAYRYKRHHLLGVCAPPLGRCTRAMLANLDSTLSHSPVLIETLALTDFASLRFYNNTPTQPHHDPLRRARLYTLPAWQYAAWWDKLPFPTSLCLDQRKFDLYAKKLRLWGGTYLRSDETDA